MKKHLPTLAVFAAIMLGIACSPNYNDKKRYPIGLSLRNGSGWNVSISTLLCDSVQMQTPQHATVWIDSTAMQIRAERITIFTNSGL